MNDTKIEWTDTTWNPTASFRPTSGDRWGSEFAPGAYLDGTAQELLLLMSAADELRRRMEVENG